MRNQSIIDCSPLGIFRAVPPDRITGVKDDVARVALGHGGWTDAVQACGLVDRLTILMRYVSQLEVVAESLETDLLARDALH